MEYLEIEMVCSAHNTILTLMNKTSVMVGLDRLCECCLNIHTNTLRVHHSNHNSTATGYVSVQTNTSLYVFIIQTTLQQPQIYFTHCANT
ncbi:hypothetical protein AC249_AIPGENE6214 [Exaiptasia diaphana]|nr:hypothetical protein AC249_AIPGENE6214 [Exaiptasia diaphana]